MHNHTWHIGEAEITQLVELEENSIFSTFIPDAKPDLVRQIPWLFPHFADETGNLKALVQSFLIKSQGKHILVDTCNGNHKDRPNVPEWGNLKTDYLKKFSTIGVNTEAIDMVICTHLHFDHVGWNTRLENGTWVPTFPHAKYLFSQGEYEYWIQKPEKEMIDDFNGIDDSVSPIVEAGLAQFVSDDYHINSEIRLMPTPGHTPHHVSVVIESQGQKAVISGDVLHHPCQMVHPEWTTLADTYPAQTVQTRNVFLAEMVDTDILVIGSHFSGPVAGYVRREGGSLRFVSGG